MAVPTAHGVDEDEGGQSRAVFAVIAILFSFLVHTVSGRTKGVGKEEGEGDSEECRG